MKKKYTHIGLFSACIVAGSLLAHPARADFYIGDGEITIDNIVSEDEGWGEPIINDGEDNPDRTRYCWVNGSTWTAMTDPAGCTTVIWDEEGEIDIANAWVGMNETNMYLAYESVAPNYSLTNAVDGSFISLYDDQTLSTFGMTGLPGGFAHDFVFSFDVDPVEGEESYDWYLAAHLLYEFGTGVGPGDNEAFIQIYSESGTNTGYQADEDTMVSNFDLSDIETVQTTDPSDIDPIFELRLNIEQFYDVTGISAGDEVGFRLETHSATGDTTAQELVTFVDSAVTEDSIVVGDGGRTFTGRTPSAYRKGVFRVYAESDQTQTLAVTAYAQKVGVQVAVGNVDADNDLEIITLQFKSVNRPQIKVFNLNGELEASGHIPTKATRLKQYHLAVGDVTGAGRDEIVLSNTTGERALIDVIQLKDNGKFTRVAQHDEELRAGYSAGAWVEVANIDTTTDQEEIVTAPFKGSALIDLWDLAEDGETIEHIVQYDEITVPEGYAGGLHIAAAPGEVWAVPHLADAQAQEHEWVEAKGNLEPAEEIFTVGRVGDIAYSVDQLLYSRFDAKKVIKKDSDGATLYSIDTNSRGGFVDFITFN